MTEQPVKAHCNQCGSSTNHRLIHQSTSYGFHLDEMAEADSAGPDTADFSFEYDMLQCCGCDSVCLRQTSYGGPLFGETDEKEVQFYPPRIYRPFPPWRDYLPEDIAGLLNEVYAALAANSRRLAVMGVRTLVDMVILDKVGDQGPFRQKLETLESKGYISKANREYLQSAIETGHAAAHRGHKPSEGSVEQAMDIVENLLQAVYVLQHASDRLKEQTPPRWPKGT